MSEFGYAVFRHLAVENAGPPPSDSQRSAIESCLGAALPEAFVSFLNVANGGTLEYVIDVPAEDGSSEELSFCSLFCAGDGSALGTFIGELRLERLNASLPERVLPFARDGGGSTVYLDLSDEGGGRVVAFVQGLPAWSGRGGDSRFVELAASFDDYVAKLRLDREAALDHLTHDIAELAGVDATERYLDIGLPKWRTNDEALVVAVRNARSRIGG